MKVLSKYENHRITLQGTFERHGTKTDWRGKKQIAILLLDVTVDGEPVSNHTWFSTDGFRALFLKKGDRIEFRAKVEKYASGRHNYEPVYDYRYTRPTKIRKMEA